ncbi:MAG: O-methyltransferase [Anaerolineae bacterium]|uniref:O-methyltransferase n=1 Tax=Promineifilum sp. TaxID=2664178 RepID=UPI001DA3F394|nr:O-methyltransferase [Anaerolineales bacterium]MCO5178859.1 O-methyltransferase [Promineifilum sp.]MCW5848181.1 O-methyltransferase [Anaerolineae bacterium]
MSTNSWTTVDDYITALFVPADPALAAALADSAAAGLPEIAVSPAQGKLLTVLARAMGARSILEIGTLGGYSAICLARALPANGKLITLEFSPKHAEVARANVARAGLADRVEVIVGPAGETLPRLAAEGRGPFDLIFIDADKVSYGDYLRWSLRLSRPGTLIIADNVVRDGRVIDPTDDDPNVVGVRQFNDMLAAEPRIDATILQTVGSKGYDGLAIAVVTG